MQFVAYSLATLAMLCIGAGLFFAADRRRHVPFMYAAFTADIVGLLIVEFTTNPFASLVERSDGWTLRVIHASFATLSLVGYAIQIVTGKKLLRADRSVLSLHHKAAKGFLLTRVAAYITMFMV